jgi:histidine triad (HIT) family protein
MSSETLFSKIIAREIPADIVYETDTVLAFRDIAPQAPTHVLIIPKKPIATINDLTEDDVFVMGELFLAAKEVASLEGLSEQGYRVTMNCGEAAGQSVFHVHLHLLGGRTFSWPPG